jgi:hypothetical protein
MLRYAIASENGESCSIIEIWRSGSKTGRTKMHLCRRRFLRVAGGSLAIAAGGKRLGGSAAAVAAPLLERLPTVEQIRAGAARNWKLVDLINQHRDRFGLSRIPLSPRLTLVAYLHARDLAESRVYERTGNLHSWSDDPRWRGGAYRPDDPDTHGLMWDKPREIAGYDAHGFEICAVKTKDEADALRLWTKSQSHHDVILNRGVWADRRWTWRALGAVFFNGYACAWFGNVRDAEGPQPEREGSDRE